MEFSQSQGPISYKKLGRFEASKIIVRESWSVLKQDREMLWFPVLSMILCLLFTATAILIAYVFWTDAMLSTSDSETPIYLGYFGIFLTYIAMFFIGNFANAGVLVIAYGRFNGKDLTFKDGFNGALNNVGKIFIWSVICATVKIILDYISDKFKWIGKVVAVVLGAAWDILTYFSFPSIIIGQNSIRTSFKESANLIKKTWGETFIINFGVGLFFSIIFLGLCAIGFLFAYLWQVTFITIATVCVCAAALLVMTIFSSTLSTIFKLALYEYARTGIIPQGFSKELIEASLKR